MELVNEIPARRRMGDKVRIRDGDWRERGVQRTIEKFKSRQNNLMCSITLSLPTNFKEINTLDDNIDVCIELSNGKQYTIVVATPQNLQTMMKNSGKPYVEPCSPILFVERINELNIKLLIDKLVQDPILLRVYGEDLK